MRQLRRRRRPTSARREHRTGGRSHRVPHRQVIVFFAADSATSRLALDEECAAVERELRMTAHRDAFEFHSRWAVDVNDIQRSLNELQPTIIHFSGHGALCSPFGEASIVVRGVDGNPHHLTGNALAELIRTAASGVRLVVLNACYTAAMANQLCAVVDGVVTMAGAIADPAARAFAVSLYRALGYMRSVGNAVAQGVAALTAFGLPEARLPTCVTRSGLAPDDLVLLRVDREPEPSG
jgi:CHAT domain-containing protein